MLCFSRVALFLFAFTLSAIASSRDENIARVNFPMDEHSMVMVLVSINGAGPFNFLLDTGNTTTIVDHELARQLSLPLVGQSVVTGLEATLDVSIARTRSISIAGRSVHNLNVNVLPATQSRPNVRGVLGEDFLSNFDLLIDNRHHVIELQLGPGPMSEMFEGERLPVKLEGNVDGSFYNNRLIVDGFSSELSNKAISLQLDSAANVLYLFGGRESLGIGATLRKCSATTISSTSYRFNAYRKKVRQLSFGQKKLDNVMAYALPSSTDKDTDGLMPTSAFHSIFISHSQKFVIFDPSKSTPARQRI